MTDPDRPDALPSDPADEPLRALQALQSGAVGGRSLDRPLAALATRDPVSCTPDTPLRAVLERMQRLRIGSMVVVDGAQRPLGVFTLHDVLERVALPATDLGTPVGEAMSRQIWTLPPEAPAFEAALLMARENIRHVPLVADGRLVGVVSESRLFSLWRGGIEEARAEIRAARDIAAVAAAAGRIRALPGRLLEEGIGADAITGLVTALNDLVTVRLIELTGAGAALVAAGGCWIALGSAGRGEQTLATDQDNAIVFADDADPDGRRAALVSAADAVNRALDGCGLPLCRGGIMAGNPRWCLAATEWRRRFAEWIDRPEPEALLNAAIFFDFRPVWGERGIVAALRAWLAAYAADRTGFLLLMSQNALGNPPPLGLVRDFVLASGGDHPGTLDLKVNGVQPFVESLRIYALAAGVTSTGTLERIAGVARARGVPAVEAEAWREAFRFLQLLRLRLNAAQAARGDVLHNHLDPDSLNELDRRILKEALRQARKLQARLARDFSVRGGGFGA
jgi:CBS domain-containing protein